MQATKSEFLTVRVEPAICEALAQIRDAYGLKSRSEAIRAAVRQVAAERGLDVAGETSTKEIKHE